MFNWGAERNIVKISKGHTVKHYYDGAAGNWKYSDNRGISVTVCAEQKVTFKIWYKWTIVLISPKLKLTANTLYSA
jgi:hypothetical protein